MTHSAFILSHHSLGLTLLPSRLILCMSGPTRGRCGFGTYLVASGCTYGLGTVSFHSFSLSVSFAAVSIRYTYRLAPWLLYLLSDLNKCFRLLTGFARCTTLGVCGRCRIRTCDVPGYFIAFIHSANLPCQNQRTSLRAGIVKMLNFYFVNLNKWVRHAWRDSKEI